MFITHKIYNNYILAKLSVLQIIYLPIDTLSTAKLNNRKIRRFYTTSFLRNLIVFANYFRNGCHPCLILLDEIFSATERE